MNKYAIGFSFAANQRTKAERDGAGNTIAFLTTNEQMRFAMADTVQSQNPRERKITQELLRAALSYDPLAGVFRWRLRPERGRLDRTWNANFAGKIAGCVRKNGYIVIVLTVDGKKRQIYAHRLAFIYMTGECPPLIDHEDRNKQNNKWSNLRPATRSQNGHNRTAQSNNKSGLKGVDLHKASGKWRATIYVNNRHEFLGHFDSAQEAHAAYCAAADRYHREFACYGNGST